MKEVYFCPQCGAKLEQGQFYYDYENDQVYVQHCPECSCEDEVAIPPKFDIGDEVVWNDPCNDYENDNEYEQACQQVRIVTDIIAHDGDEVIYELDNGTEVPESEIEEAEC